MFRLLLPIILLTSVSMVYAAEPQNSMPVIEMVSVPGGCFQMGDTFGDGSANEKPAHTVCVDGFSIGKYEVTQKQWQAVMGGNPSHNKLCGSDCPVASVSWKDVQIFIARINEITGMQFRLPTEAEWEYAARSGGKSEKWAGTSELKDLKTYAWYKENAENKSHPVGQKKPNSLGIHDLSGNVWEWVQDRFSEDYYKFSPKSNPTGPTSGGLRVLRGGSWVNSPKAFRASLRNREFSEESSEEVGFRLALSSK